MSARTLSVLGVIVSISLVLVIPIRAVYQASQLPPIESGGGLSKVGDEIGSESPATGQAGFSARDAGPLRSGETSQSSLWINSLRLYGGSDDGPSLGPRLAGDGRYVAFLSGASNLVDGDTNGFADVFVRDRADRETTRVSVASDGSQSTDVSALASISPDGRYLGFESYAGNLVDDDTNGYADIFVYDRETEATTRASVARDGSQGDGASVRPSLSSYGRYVAFQSSATNLVNEDTNGMMDVFVYNRLSGTIARVSVASDGTQANDESLDPSISAGGSYVAFESIADNLVSEDTNGTMDVFVNASRSTTTRVSVASDGEQANGHSWDPSISADGGYVAFRSDASNLVEGDTNGVADIFVHNRYSGETTRVSVASDGSEANGRSGGCSISGDGRYVAFQSYASNLVSGDANGCADVFVHDRATGETIRVSVASDGTEANGCSGGCSISANGRYVAFESYASNLVAGDTDGYADVFVYDQDTGETTWVSVASDDG